MKFFSQYNIELLHILKFQVLSRFSAKCLIFSRFAHVLDIKFQAISGPGEIKFKSPGFAGFQSGNPD